MRKITKYPKLVLDEAKNLRKFASPKEKDSLDIDTFNPESRFRCIYGQLTGDCHSSRAEMLIQQCAKRVYHTREINEQSCPKYSNKLNGKPKPNMREYYWSPIEVWIQRFPPEMNYRLINYIKGNIKSLK